MNRNLQIRQASPWLGVNVQVAPSALLDGEYVSGQNMCFRFDSKEVLWRRKGSLVWTTLSDPISAHYWFDLPGYSPSPIVVTTSTAGDVLYSGDPLTPMTGPALPAGGTYTFVPYTNVLYIFNGMGNVYTTTDGTTYQLATLPAYMPGPPLSGFIYYDRMYFRFGRGTYGNYVAYSDPTAPLSMTFPEQFLVLGDYQDTVVTAFGFLSADSAIAGPYGSLAIFKETELWTLSGDPVLAGTVFAQVSNIVGCLNQATVVNTPIGLIWVSYDNIYMSSEAAKPVNIGDYIYPLIQNLRGTGLYSQMFAIYHNDFYKLYFPNGQGGIVGYWYNTLPHQNILQGWYGPMTGLNLTCAALDTHQNIYGGDSSGVFWELDQDTYLDGSNLIPISLTTKEYIEGSFYLTKKYFGIDLLGSSTTQGTITVEPFIDGDPLGYFYANFGQPVALWDQAVWDNFTWNGPQTAEIGVKFAPPQIGKRIQFILNNNDNALVGIEYLAIQWSPVRKIK